MKYKQQILTKIDAVENALKYANSALDSNNISAAQLVEIINVQLKKVQSIKDLIEAES